MNGNLSDTEMSLPGCSPSEHPIAPPLSSHARGFPLIELYTGVCMGQWVFMQSQNRILAPIPVVLVVVRIMPTAPVIMAVVWDGGTGYAPD